MSQLPQLLGATLLLAGFAAAQMGRLKNGSMPYLILNGLGALLLGIDAVRAKQVGFIVLEGVWLLISLVGIVKLLRTPSGSA